MGSSRYGLQEDTRDCLTLVGNRQECIVCGVWLAWVGECVWMVACVGECVECGLRGWDTMTDVSAGVGEDVWSISSSSLPSIFSVLPWKHVT